MGCPMSKRVQTSSDMSASPVQTTDSSVTTPGIVKSECSRVANISEGGYVAYKLKDLQSCILAYSL